MADLSKADFSFPFEERPYIFTFNKERDDFSQVSTSNLAEGGNDWELVEEPYTPSGHGMRCLGNDKTETNAWLFSRGFEMKAGQAYDVVIYYRGHGPCGKSIAREISGNSIRLGLYLGREQSAEAMKQQLFDVGVTNKDYQYIKVTTTVPRDGVYFFGGNAHSEIGAGAVVLAVNGVSHEAGLNALLR